MFAFDIDGTLIRSTGEVSPAVREAVASARASGIVVGVSTGRPWPQARDAAYDAGGVDYAVCLNGAVVADGDGTPIAVRSLRAEQACQAATIARRILPGVTLAADMADGRHFWEHDFDPMMPVDMAAVRVADGVDAIDGDVLTWLLAVPGMGPEAIVEALRHEMPVGTEVRPSGLDMAEIAAFGVNKASGLQIVADRFGVQREEVAAFGDGLNDLEMLRWAGLPVAMANAPEQVQALGRIVAPSNDDDGVAAVISQLLTG